MERFFKYYNLSINVEIIPPPQGREPQRIHFLNNFFGYGMKRARISGPFLLLRRSESLRHSLNRVFSAVYIHYRDAWYLNIQDRNELVGQGRDSDKRSNLSDFTLELLIASGNNVAPVLLTTVQQAVVCIRTRVSTW